MNTINPSGSSPASASYPVLATQAKVAPTPAPAPMRSAPTKAEQPVTAPSAPAAPSAAELKQAVSELQQKTRVTSPDLQFSIDEDTGQTVIKITDATTKEVIRQIPPEEVIRLNKELDRMQGLLLHKQV
jgi:flagellar protein FlaG